MSIVKFLKVSAIILLVIAWIFSGWPSLWQNPSFPPEVKTVSADTTNTNYAGTAADGATGEKCSWSSPSNATGDTTGSATTCDMRGNGSFTNILEVTNFGFTSSDIPSGATINGVTVEVEWQGGSSIQDTTAQLTTDGSNGVGNNKGSDTTHTSKAIQTYGGSADGWGASLTQADVTSSNFGILLQYQKNSGGPSELTSVYRVRVTIDYTPVSTFEQSGYRFFSNQDSTDVGSALATENTGVTLTSSGENFRLRNLLHVSNAELAQSGQDFKLQFADKDGGTCSSPGGSYTDVTSSTNIAYNGNGSVTDGDPLTDNANDPTHSGHTINNQTYEEGNNFTNSQSAIAAGEDGLWDFSLTDNGAPEGATYCLRAVKSDGNTLSTYSQYPEITTHTPPQPVFSAEDFRFFSNQDSTDVGSALASENTGVTFTSAEENFRLRSLLHVSNAELAQSGQDFTLEYADQTGYASCSAVASGDWGGVTSAKTPAQVGTISSVDLNGADDIAISGNYAYVAASNAGALTAVDISTPASTTVVDTISNTDLEFAEGVAISGNYAYVPAAGPDALTVVDISTPSNLTQVGTTGSTVELDGPRDVAISGNHAYVVTAVDRIVAVDISTPSSPTQVGFTRDADNLSGAENVAISGNYAFVAAPNSNALTAIDISTPSSPTFADTVSTSDLNGASDVAISGNYAYVAASDANALTVIDISTPTNLTQVGTVSTSDLGNATGVTASSSYAYVTSSDFSENSGSLNVVDISSSSSPTQVGTVTTSDLHGAAYVAISGNYAHVTAGTGDALTSFDLTSPPIHFNDNDSVTDGAALTDNANDPTHNTDTTNNQTYEEGNNFTNSQSAIAAGEDGLWDFSLAVSSSAPTSTTYCLRPTEADGTTLDTYNQYPEVTTYDGTSAVSVSISDGIVSYGTLSGDTASSTVGSDTQTVSNDGSVTIDLNIQGQDTACPWTLSSTTGIDQYIHEFSTNSGSSWTALTTTYQTLATGIGTSGTQNFDLQVTTPTDSSCDTLQSVDVVVQAVEQ